MAPIEIKLAECPVSTISAKANSTAKGMVSAVTRVRRQSPSIASNSRVTRPKPKKITWRTVSVVTPNRSESSTTATRPSSSSSRSISS